MGGMYVSIPGILGPRLKGRPHNYMFGEFMKHLKMLRDDPKLHTDFFDAYVFEDGQDFRDKKKTAPVQQTTNGSTKLPEENIIEPATSCALAGSENNSTPASA